MDLDTANRFVISVYELAFRRKPSATELETQGSALASGHILPEAFLFNIENTREFEQKKGVHTQFTNGHFHSPVVDPKTVKNYFEREIGRAPNQLCGIDLNTDAMRRLWIKNLKFIQSTPFLNEPSKENRYGYKSGPFPHGDAIALRMIIQEYRPKRIIEIGSGWSSACMLDSAEQVGLDDTAITCIDPNTSRLKSIMRTDDYERVTIIEKPIQDVDEQIVDSLRENDILFIDSTHVVKTGSDVHHEIFYLLPRLRSGVIVHFHDIMYPFEYPRKWVFESNFSWNEAYFLRSFLMYNREFEVIFWNSLIAKLYNKEITEEFPKFLHNPGGSIWLKRA